MEEINKIKISMAHIEEKLDAIFASEKQNKEDHDRFYKAIKDYVDSCDNKFVTKDSFGPVQKLVYGMAGAMLIALLGAIMAGVFR